MSSSFTTNKTFIENLRITDSDLSWPDPQHDPPITINLNDEPLKLKLVVEIKSVLNDSFNHNKTFVLALISTSTLGSDDFNSPLEKPLYANSVGVININGNTNTITITFTFEDSTIPHYKNLLQPFVDLSKVTDYDSFDNIKNNTKFVLTVGQADFYNFVLYQFDQSVSYNYAINLIKRNILIGIPLSYYYYANALCDVKAEKLNTPIVEQLNDKIKFTLTSLPHMVTHCQAPKPIIIPYLNIKYGPNYVPPPKNDSTTKSYILGALFKIASNELISTYIPY